MIDLTFGITSKLKVFPGSPQPSFIKWSKFDIHGYDSEAMFLSTHTETHVDAPSHFISNAANIDQIAVDRFFCRNALLVKILIMYILIIENLCNLEKINRNRFTLMAIPLKLIGSTGSPVRAIGIEG
jgi:kynurenine formamidase